MTVSYREIAIERSLTQPKMVDQLLNASPLLAGMPMQESTDGLKNTYEEQGDVVGAGLTSLDGELISVSSDSDVKQVDLSILGGKIFCGEDKANQFGGFNAYLNSKIPSILRQSGMDAEASIIYNNIRKFAIDNGNAIDAGGVGSTNYSAICVNWVPGEVTGLFDPTGFGKGALMDIKLLNGGGAFAKVVDGKEIIGYEARLKTYLGLQLANDNYVSAIVNADKINSQIPTEAMIDDMISNAQGSTDSTVIYMHQDLLNVLNAYKASALTMIPSEGNVDRRVAAWNGIPIVTSYNFLKGTEAKV